MATGTFTGESASGWQTLTFASPVNVTAGSTYVVSYYAPNGHYSNDTAYFTADMTRGPLTAPGSDNGVYPVWHRWRVPHRHLELLQLLGRRHLHPGTTGFDGAGDQCGDGGAG